MSLCTDFSQRVVIESGALPWIDSPDSPTQRRPLEYDNGAVARATFVERHAPGTRQPPHGHNLGEEILVLAGVYGDELGIYPAGTYIKNPPGSHHAPFSIEGCTLFVKQQHLDTLDGERVVLRTHDSPWLPGLVPGLSVMPLAEFRTQHTALVRWAPGTYFNPHRHYGGEEIFVIDGVFADEHGQYPAGTWLRSPHLSHHHPYSHAGCTILVKTGHLPPTRDGT